MEREIEEYLNKPEHKRYQEIAEKTKKFLKGFYSNFGLEPLSTVDFISEGGKIDDAWQIKNKIETWSDRKNTLFASDPHFIDAALDNLKTMSC